VLVDDSVGDAPATANEFMCVNLLSKKDAVVLLELIPMCANRREAIAPISVAYANRRQAELVCVKGLVNVEGSNSHEANASGCPLNGAC
jgi:hypothetical protein